MFEHFVASTSFFVIKSSDIQLIITMVTLTAGSAAQRLSSFRINYKLLLCSVRINYFLLARFLSLKSYPNRPTVRIFFSQSKSDSGKLLPHSRL